MYRGQNIWRRIKIILLRMHMNGYSSFNNRNKCIQLYLKSLEIKISEYIRFFRRIFYIEFEALSGMLGLIRVSHSSLARAVLDTNHIPLPTRNLSFPCFLFLAKVWIVNTQCFRKYSLWSDKNGKSFSFVVSLCCSLAYLPHIISSW